MASLKCNNCGTGIHYHNTPCGIEYTLIPVEIWNCYLNKDMTICKITLDVPNSYLTVWRCPECGCLHIFEGASTKLQSVYIPSKNESSDISGKKYCVFDDYTFETIAENDITPNAYENSDEYPSHCYAIIDDDYIYLSDNKDFINITDIFKSIKK